MPTGDKVRISQVPIPFDTVRISLPAEVAFSFGKLQRTIRSIAENIGCPRCFSGVNCAFLTEKSLVIDAKTFKGSPPKGVVIING